MARVQYRTDAQEQIRAAIVQQVAVGRAVGAKIGTKQPGQQMGPEQIIQLVTEIARRAPPDVKLHAGQLSRFSRQ
jgi:hypothetical protein